MKTNRLRLWLAVFLITVCVLPAGAASASSEIQKSVAVKVNGSKLDVEAHLIDGRTMVPLRAIFEQLSATLEWEPVTRSITATKGSTVVHLQIDNVEAKINDRASTLDVPPLLVHGSTYVPLRFVSEALGADVDFDSTTNTAIVSTDSSCNLPGGQVHSGTIKSGGETWGVCGSPHFVKDDIYVEGKDSPNLVIEAGAVVRFEKGTSIFVGLNAPGGLVIEGTEKNPAILTADTAGAQPGFWKGIHFYEQTVKGRASIDFAQIEYAGGENGAVTVTAGTSPVELTVRDTQFKQNAYAGIQLTENTRLSSQSKNLTITGTKTSPNGGGAPIITAAYGTHQLPDGNYKGNDLDVVLIAASMSSTTINTNTTWNKLSIPYQAKITVYVDGPSSPVLTIAPGTVTIWEKLSGLTVGSYDKGGLIAKGTKDQPITFTSQLERPGSWDGIGAGPYVGKDFKLDYVVIKDAVNGITLPEDLGPFLTNSTIENSKEYGIYIKSSNVATDYLAGNTFRNNAQDIYKQ
ncbi:copper amine oxidase N-terminal domain-containing protein [Paenibacillus silviterrae]|uniref:copper amine oxidase N-terminal domain-containing protein n=1 Tax=Paenibacillus silviterrae TaxID=3242194 RepID=UPI0025434699|nr:copper amine oxidase N-terminal domain-containing protein [Paenibacillus chinjuensis]